MGKGKDTEPISRQIVVKAIVTHRNHPGQILLVRVQNSPDGVNGWDLPGGKDNEDASRLDTAIRELHEELGPDCQPHLIGKDSPIGTYSLKNNFIWLMHFELQNDPIEDFTPTAEITEAAWFNAEDLAEGKIEGLRFDKIPVGVRDYLDGRVGICRCWINS